MLPTEWGAGTHCLEETLQSNTVLLSILVSMGTTTTLRKRTACSLSCLHQHIAKKSEMNGGKKLGPMIFCKPT